MKFKLTFKSPDVLDQLENDEEKDVAREYVEYSEYIAIEFDTETREAKVLKVKG